MEINTSGLEVRCGRARPQKTLYNTILIGTKYWMLVFGGDSKKGIILTKYLVCKSCHWL